ncbi:acyl-CoA dehydrogenase [Oleiphilus sp. HI0081]|jgi:alkylation response protein AidB-like acyl-CoA dehydrogenase|uniref:acyl-CoA dehydrogenase family protein n=3 Tax=Oleiphilus TaxID=141450 RepID=UPI0007C2ACC3|nr:MULTISPECIES: acyl-CoA dehydrogenase family protein [unclassified Oleiphilus]KZY76853.1 acyl-CoA dehydrogenase [Oleiphilus sp. HI0068]KZY82364.1 acyl-CoA dehydrogenase [Oleiphilus sp. HI0069]KZZ20236.1 acyl-CoA dehydrogenase [Oleiphilus sp. HI0078]KZZ21520.1 acyl-CoA dehydrogenase [Oleiphilus sp. HI0081]KZY38467.1 acyl-CoA dehydrogenase [Oleiphilus sp. HI0043]
MNYDLNEDQLAFQETAKRFAETELAPQASIWDAACEFPKQAFVEAGKLGFMAMYVPEADKGIGLSRLDSSIIMEELASGCTSTAAFISIHNMAFNMLARYGRKSLVDQWSEALASGRKLVSYCLTEPGAGSDAASLTTSGKLEGDHYIVNGCKAFISGAGDTDLLVTMLRTGEAGPKGITCLAIPATSEGISFGKKEEKLGWSNQPTRLIHFENVRVPKENLLAHEGDGFKLAMEGLDGGRINIAACSVGTARASLRQSISYVKERKQFNQTIADFQATQFKLSDMLTELVASRQMIRLAAFKLDQGAADKSVHCAMAKRLATDLGFKICDEALQLHGGYGYIKEYPIERYFRDTRVHRILEGTNEVMRLIIARALLSDENFQLLG